MKNGVKNIQAAAYNGAHTVVARDKKLFKFQTFAPGTKSFLFGQQIVEPNWYGTGPDDLGENVYYSLSTLGEIQFSRSVSDAPENWPGYAKWTHLKDGFNQRDGGYYLR